MFSIIRRPLFGGLVLLLGLALLAAALGSLSLTRAGAATVAATPGAQPGTVAFQVRDFGPLETVTATLGGPAGSTLQIPTSQTTDLSGAIAFEQELPRWAEAGTWTVAVRGERSGREANTIFNLPPIGENISLSVDQPSAPAGTPLRFSSPAFEPEELVQYRLNGPDGRTYLGSKISASPDGQLVIEATVAEDLPRGQWRLQAYGMKSNSLGSVTFEVR